MQSPFIRGAANTALLLLLRFCPRQQAKDKSQESDQRVEITNIYNYRHFFNFLNYFNLIKKSAN